MDGVAIEVRINEYMMRDANPHVPWSPEEIAVDAAACAEAGASIVHYHARDPHTGRPATAVELYGETITRTRDLCDVVLMPTLGANTLPDPADRVAHILEMAGDPATCPELAPVDFGSFNLDPYRSAAGGFSTEDLVYLNPVRTVRYLIETLGSVGVMPACVLWSVGSARLLGALLEMGVLPQPVYAEVMLSSMLLSTHPGTVSGMRALLEFMPPALPGDWSLISVGGNLLPLIGPAVEAGGHISIGLGDYAYPELGCPTNAELVAHVVRMLEGLGRRPATAAEVRDQFGLTPALTS